MPIHVGTPDPLLISPHQPHAPQAEALADRWRHDRFAPRNTAVDFLRETIRSMPGEVTLLTIGPLTNVALLFAIDPEAPRLLKRLVMMGGRYFSRSPDGFVTEWNILCDPHAAAKVFAAPVPEITAVGIDVTQQCELDAAECRRQFQAAGGALLPVVDMAEVWFRHARSIWFHDPLAAAVVFEPELCRFRAAHVEVDLASAKACGQTLLTHEPATHPHHLAESVEIEAFFEHYFHVVSLPAEPSGPLR